MLRVSLCAVVLFVLSAVASLAAEIRGTLVYSDGNRATGRLISEGQFASDRFGPLRFRPEEAHFLADPPAAEPTSDSPAPVSRQASTAATRAATLAPQAPATWHVSIDGYLDHTQENSEPRDEYYLSTQFHRPRVRDDEFKAHLSYEYIRKNQLIDTRRAHGDAEWLHDLGNTRWFSLTRGTAEYDGRNLDDVNALLYGRRRLNYLVSQAELGAGYRLLDTEHYKTKIAVTGSWIHVNIFDVLHADTHAFSAILENELVLPWKLKLSHRTQIYRVALDNSYGIENRIDLTRELTEHLHLTLRHEYRNNYPVLDANDLDRLRLLFGANF